LAWLKYNDPVNWQEWIDKHIFALFAVGAAHLGSPSSIRSIVRFITSSRANTVTAGTQTQICAKLRKKTKKKVKVSGDWLSIFAELLSSPDLHSAYRWLKVLALVRYLSSSSILTAA
jgi:hypothetical protein